jgi:glycosyltransferase involved in cell wall biosynthesis
MGKAVVSTSIGCEGLRTVDGQNILVRDTPESFSQAVLSVLSDSELRLRLGESARETAKQNYSWDTIGRDLCAYYWQQLRKVP